MRCYCLISSLSNSDLQTALSGLYDRAQAIRAEKATKRSKTKARIENTDQQLNLLIESMKDKIYAMTDDVERKVGRGYFYTLVNSVFD